jgi:AcrR family transcriptional regulator
MTTAMSGRRAQAARNDQVILEAARAVFVADPSAPIAAVAERAGVGISALYRRYRSKDELLQRLCGDGLETYIEAAEAAVVDEGDAWEMFARFLQRVVQADTHSLTVALAGTFPPTEELYERARRAGELAQRVVDRAQEAGAIRADFVVGDLGLIFEQLAAIRLGGERRTEELRARYLAMFLDAIRHPGATLPGPAPEPGEFAGRWGAPRPPGTR